VTPYWAKTISKETPGIGIDQHGEYVRSVLNCLYDVFNKTVFPPSFTKNFLGFLAAVHDVGKISREFQAKCPAWLVMNSFEEAAQQGDWKNGLPHNEISQDALERFFKTHVQGQKEAKACWGSIIGAHHGRIARSFTEDYLPLAEAADKKDWERDRQTFLLHFWQECCCTALPPLRQDSPEMWTAAGILTLADWIGSDENFFSADPAKIPESLEQAAAEAVAQIGLGPLKIRSGLVFEDIFPFKPNSMQLAACETITGPGVYVIEAPMGMGKTEAALMAAYKVMAVGKARGLYFGLPTQATSNRIFLRVEEFAKCINETHQPVQLIHANTWLDKDKSPVSELSPAPSAQHEKGVSHADAHDWFSSSRRALLAPIGVGTADQAMLAALAVKHFPLRRLALAGKVVILDEVHSYDCYTGTIIQKLCELLQELHCTVIVLSATLTQKYCTALLKSEAQPKTTTVLPPYPLVHSHQQGQKATAIPTPPPKEKRVAVVFTPQEQMFAQSLHHAEQGAQVLWICNSVGRAQETYELLREACAANNVELGLLHARLPFFMRQKREHYWMDSFGKNGARQHGAILIATQIAEQSVDLDADMLVTELAPTDMLLQRMGRLWRHQRASRPCPAPCLYILQEKVSLSELRAMRAEEIKNAFGVKAFVYAPYVLAQTLNIWSGISHVTLPSQIRELIEATYNEPDDLPPGWVDLYDQLFGGDMARKHKALMNTNIWQQAWADVEDIAPTRLIEHTEFSFVLYQKKEGRKFVLLDGSVIDTSTSAFCNETARNLHRNMVKIFEYRLAGARQDAWLKKYRLFGWARIQDDSVHIQGAKDTNTGWNTTLGIIWPKTKEQA
jgi:CRISPR-associated endonuclease/helicase Cas3